MRETLGVERNITSKSVRGREKKVTPGVEVRHADGTTLLDFAESTTEDSISDAVEVTQEEIARGLYLKVIIPFYFRDDTVDFCSFLSESAETDKGRAYSELREPAFKRLSFPKSFMVLRKPVRFYDEMSGAWFPSEVLTEHSDLVVKVIAFPKEILKNVGYLKVFISNIRINEKFKRQTAFYAFLLSQTTSLEGEYVTIGELGKKVLLKFAKGEAQQLKNRRIARRLQLAFHEQNFLFSRPNIVVLGKFDELPIEINREAFTEIEDWWLSSSTFNYMDYPVIGGTDLYKKRRKVFALTELLFLKSFVLHNVLVERFVSQKKAKKRFSAFSEFMSALFAFGLYVSQVQTRGILRRYASSLSESYDIEGRKKSILDNVRDFHAMRQNRFLESINRWLLVVASLQLVFVVLGVIIMLLAAKAL